ncbi:MAG: hypothetical protein HOA16_08075 [Opitutae bacterium]|jgi:hypothetical protein|nr:hypothetical protein [Opitutae bacterium]MBT7742351.1 hypothetical protein [Opitutae bacterium]
MPTSIHKFSQNQVIGTSEYELVNETGDALLTHLNRPDVRQAINAVNQPKVHSKEVQSVFLDFALELGFQSEKKGLFSHYSTKGLRPDYFKRITNTGILLEIERGKTTQNNMDLLDFWKCHICEHANHLFLLVPQSLTQNQDSKPTNEFKKVVNRMEPFFEERNYTRVRSLFVFGY